MTGGFLFSFGLAVAGAIALLALLAMRRRLVGQSSKIADANRRFRATFDQAGVGSVQTDLDSRWLRVNDRFCEMIGYRREELLGASSRDITHPDDRAIGPASVETMLSGDKNHASFEKRYIRKDGGILWGHVTGSLVRDAAGRPDFFVGIVADIGARKEAEAQLVGGGAQYRAIFDSAVEAMVVIDAKGKIQSMNPAVGRMFLYAPAEIIGQNIKELMPETTGSHRDHYLGYQDSGKRAIIGIGREVIGRRKDGSLFPLDLSVNEWEHHGDTTYTCFTCVMRDASVRKDGEAALRASEEELRLLHIEFAHLARVNDLGEMAAAIAHEINQPLTAIVNYLNTALALAHKGYSEDAFAEADEMMREASGQALRAGEIVRRLREFVGQGKGVRKAERIEHLVDSAMALALIDARSSGIEVDRISGAGDARVEVDAVQVQQILVNLLRNAVDALASAALGRPRRLSVSTFAGVDGFVEVAVADNGPGIAPELQDRMFEPFVTTKPDGMGMGLSVCRRLIEAHGGDIRAESEPGAGATFKFHLPRFGPGFGQPALAIVTRSS